MSINKATKKVSLYLTEPEWIKLRIALIKQNLTFSQWLRVQVTRYLQEVKQARRQSHSTPVS